MKNKLILIIFLIIFIFSIISLYYEISALSNLKFPEFHITKYNSTVTEKKETGFYYEESNNDNIPLIILVIITTIAGLILYLERDNLKIAILKMVSLLGFFYSLFMISKFFSLGNGIRISPTPYTFEISLITTYALFLGLIIVIVSLLTSIGIRFNYQRTVKRKVDSGIKARREFEELITDLTEKYSKEHYGIRELITECYKSMCEFLEKYGIDNPKHLTAREFEEHVYNLIHYKSENLNKLTNLFEIAKYSKKELKEEDYSFALKLLNNIKEELKNAKS
jgi:hypothetical protein